ncbi:hypothetical protein F441_04437 [Phytophthora nicotianae CJ01A1]|uniref:Uncharacterized protein n=2 Tax=Phytophthora nicotianae TaxID=4792 RepID=W2XI89_PHYNI|nr:hypothetical protein L915_04341 [Phytophthora nicotianae]ETP22197.1 hypothetical protein F441_04437 [Phytophthora nicotianae CJ01A1]
MTRPEMKATVLEAEVQRRQKLEGRAAKAQERLEKKEMRQQAAILRQKDYAVRCYGFMSIAKEEGLFGGKRTRDLVAGCLQIAHSTVTTVINAYRADNDTKFAVRTSIIVVSIPSRRPSWVTAFHARNLARRRPRRPRVINTAPVFNLFSHHVRHTWCTHITKDSPKPGSNTGLEPSTRPLPPGRSASHLDSGHYFNV